MKLLGASVIELTSSGHQNDRRKSCLRKLAFVPVPRFPIFFGVAVWYFFRIKSSQLSCWPTNCCALRICQSEIFAEIGPHRPKNSRFSSSDSFRVILIADEIETRYDFITSCMVVPNCCPFSARKLALDAEWRYSRNQFRAKSIGSKGKIKIKCLSHLLCYQRVITLMPPNEQSL